MRWKGIHQILIMCSILGTTLFSVRNIAEKYWWMGG